MPPKKNKTTGKVPRIIGNTQSLSAFVKSICAISTHGRTVEGALGRLKALIGAA